MSFFINEAYAQAAAAPTSGADMLVQFLPLVLILVVFYFLLIRPQSKRAKEHSGMLSTLSKGDEIVTNGGLLGRITEVGENFVRVEIAEGTQVRIQKQAISAMMPKGTFKGSL